MSLDTRPAAPPDAAAEPSVTRSAFGPLLLLLAGALLVGFSMGRWLAPLAAWIGPVLLMRYSRDHRVRRGYPLVVVALTVAVAIGFWQVWPPLESVVLAVGYGLLLSLPYLADRVAAPWLPGLWGTLMYPLAATTLEAVNNHVNPLGAWGMTGFSQYGVLSVMQVVSVTGMLGITFLMGWVAAVANLVWERRSDAAVVRRAVIAFVTVLGIVWVGGTLRLHLAPSSAAGDTIRVAGITAVPFTAVNERIAAAPDLSAVRQVLASHWDDYLTETVREARAGADLIVWPEGAGATTGADEAANVARARDVARSEGIHLAIGLLAYHPDSAQPQENRLLVIDPAGEVVIDHVKYGGAIIEADRLVGDGRLQTAITPFGVLSGVICYDLDYPAVVRQAGSNGTGLMVVPSDDWFEIDPVHSHMAVFRAIENGTSLVRQTDEGLSIAVDPYGRVLAQVDFFGATDRTMVAQIPTRDVATLYPVIGPWLEWLVAVGLGAVLVWAWVARRARKAEDRSPSLT